MEEDLGLIGASAEDTEAELIRKICETELLAGNKSLFFSPATHQAALMANSHATFAKIWRTYF